VWKIGQLNTTKSSTIQLTGNTLVGPVVPVSQGFG